MRRVLSRNGLFFAVVFVVALVSTLPMRLMLGWIGLDAAGLTAREASGSVWQGQLTEARFGGVALGDLSAGLSPLQLPFLRARLDFARGDSLEGAATITRRGFGIDDMTAPLAVGALFAPLPIAGIDLTDASLRFVEGRCEHAEGGVRATLSGSIAGIDLAQGFAGTARCDDGRLLLPLSSPSGNERLSLRLAADGGYEGTLTVRGADAALIERLTTAGFVPGAEGYALVVAGRL